MFNFQGMNVIITGASKGIGKAIAEIFAANGHNLFLCSRGEVTLYKTMEELMTKYPAVTIKAKPFDLSKKEEAKAFGNWCLSFAVPDILGQQCRRFEPGNVHNEEEGLLESQMATNLYSAYHLTRTLLPAMMEQKAAVIFLICVPLLRFMPMQMAALTASANLPCTGFSKNLREEMKPHGIKVTSVFPGAVLTDSWGNYDNSSKRIMEADDIAKMIYAASQLSPQACVEDIVMRPQLGDL